MSREEALQQARGALAALISVEIAKARATLVEKGLDDGQIEAALDDFRRQLDEWRSRTMSDFETWMDRPTTIEGGTVH